MKSSDNKQFLGKSKFPIFGWTNGVPIEEVAMQQLHNIASMPFLHHHVAVMPDVHWGMGATIGSVIATKGAIIPAAVGVDLGCGMMAVQTSLKASQLPDNLLALRTDIEKNVPHGRTDNGGTNDRGSWHDIPLLVSEKYKQVVDELAIITAKHSAITRAAERAIYQLGTLGTGNHFIEICIDEHQTVWVMLHSGSRGIGNKIGTYFIEKAKKEMQRWFITLPDQDLAYLPEGSVLFDDYWQGVAWSQGFARINREIMMQKVLETLQSFFPFTIETGETAINCHHNYVNKEKHFGANVFVTRKGAVRARIGDLGIIPGSMGAKSFIVKGLGNPDSFCSCSHGAGRVMSRNQAKKLVTMEQHIEDTKGVECRTDEDVLDETPKAYKDIDAVMAAQSDLVEVLYTLKQVLCVKG